MSSSVEKQSGVETKDLKIDENLQSELKPVKRKLDGESKCDSSEKKSKTDESLQSELKPVKLKLDDDSNGDSSEKKSKTDETEDVFKHGNVVAAHYNTLEEKGLQERFNSPIFYMRNFNNWVKSVLINEYTEKIVGKEYRRAVRVLDLCCGKGGDLNKWQKAQIAHLICADIADVSVQQCEARYNDFKRKYSRGPPGFTAEFIAADCTKVYLREKYADASVKLDLVSCQFGFHYCFESLPQAECMLRNAAESLKPDGYFIGTIPNAYEIVSRCQKSEDNSFGNKIFNIKLLFDPSTEGYPLFGAKYDFHLEGVVDCPEFLVNFEVFVKLAAKFGLELVYKDSFGDFFKKNQDKYRNLLQKIKCFESYPPAPGKALIADESDYEHAKEHLAKSDKGSSRSCLGTMSKSEWEAATIYMVFAFKKCKNTWDEAGKAVYIYENPENKQQVKSAEKD